MSDKTKKQQILDTALSLFVHQGFYATSTASIAKAAGVATGTLFHHFSSKEALMNQLFINIKQGFADGIQAQMLHSGDFKRDTEHLWQAAIQWALEHPLRQSFFQQYSLSPAVSESIRQQAMHETLGFLSTMLQQGQVLGLLAKHPLHLMLANCHGQYLASAQFFIENPEKWGDAAHREASFTMMWRSIAK